MNYAENLQPIDRFLALAVRGQRTEPERAELLALFHRVGSAEALAAARRNQVAALAADGLAQVWPQPELPAEWADVRQSNARRVVELTAVLERVVARLESVGCRSAVIENGGVLFGSQLPLAAFSAGDFDLLVSGADWPNVKAAFQAEKFVPQDRRGRPTNRLEFSRLLSNGETQWLNAGFAPFDRMWVPLSYTDRADTWLARRRLSTKSDGIWVLAPADALAFVAIHTSLHSFVRAPGIRLHVDVDRLVRDAEIDWEQFLAEVRATGLRTRVFVSLSMAQALLATPVPDRVLQALYPGNWRWRQIMRLVSREGTFVSGRAKLTGIKAIWLDVLLEDRGLVHWLRMMLFPPTNWMREHFGRGTQPADTVAALHFRRWLTGARRWSPQ